MTPLVARWHEAKTLQTRHVTAPFTFEPNPVENHESDRYKIISQISLLYVYIYILIKIFVSMKLTRGAGREVSNSVAFQTDARTSVSHLAIRHIQCFYIYIYMMP